jgi:hypothetical protein
MWKSWAQATALSPAGSMSMMCVVLSLMLSRLQDLQQQRRQAWHNVNHLYHVPGHWAAHPGEKNMTSLTHDVNDVRQNPATLFPQHVLHFGTFRKYYGLRSPMVLMHIPVHPVVHVHACTVSATLMASGLWCWPHHVCAGVRAVPGCADATGRLPASYCVQPL